ncbi:hypothetical protein LWI28_003992 [Acer negundo]|uniref:Zinc finger PMZ-type domain-containing protein n=1 Tax=Acer negundo TaxID=4023 RepID=A0AAD5JID3_ACENE|nr:hypothetical protein LWI28_003992 [Acer negundo]
MAERQDEKRFVNVFCASPNVYEIREDQNFWIIDFWTWSCDSELWEINDIPCKHAMVVITRRRMNNNEFVHKYLTTEAYIKTYSYVIYSILNETQWPQVQHVEVLPPIEKKLQGRQKKTGREVPMNPKRRQETLEIGVETVVNSVIMLGAVKMQLLRVLTKLKERYAWTWNEIPCFSAADLTCYTNLITYIILVMDFVVVVVVVAAAAVNGILN